MKAETLSKITKPLNTIDRIITFLAMISVFIMALLTTADALGRYFLNQPIRGAFEVTENYLMIFTVYFALVFAYKDGANVRITFFVSRFHNKARLIISYFVQIFSFLYIVFLFVSATRINLGRLNKVVELTQTLSIPIWPAYLVISLGLLFLSLFVFFDLWQIKRGNSGFFKESSDESSAM